MPNKEVSKEELKKSYAIPQHRLINNRVNKNFVIIKYPKFFVKNTKAVDASIIVQPLWWVKYAQVYLGNRPYDIPVDKLETKNKIDIKFDADITYRVSGEAYFKDYWRIHQDQYTEKYLEENEDINMKPVSDRNFLIQEIDRTLKAFEETLTKFKNREDLNTCNITVAEMDNDCNLFKGVFRNVLSNYNITNGKFLDKCFNAGIVINSNDAFRDFEIKIAQYEEIIDILYTLKGLMMNPINSENYEVHRLKEANFYKIRKEAKREWSYNHPAIKFKLDNNSETINQMVRTTVKNCLVQYCSRKTYDEIRLGFVSDDALFMEEANRSLAKYGIELVDVKIKKLDQADERLSNAYAQKVIAKEEGEARKTQAQANAEAAILEAQGKATAKIEEAKGTAEANNLVYGSMQQYASSEAINQRLVADGSANYSINNFNVGSGIPVTVQQPVPASVEPQNVQDQTPAAPVSGDAQVNEQTESIIENLSPKAKLQFIKLQLESERQEKVLNEKLAEYENLFKTGDMSAADEKEKEINEIAEQLEQIEEEKQKILK